MNKIVYSRSFIIGFITLSCICLADISAIIKDVYAPPLFRAPKIESPRDFSSSRDLSINKDLGTTTELGINKDLGTAKDFQFSKPLEENLKADIKSENLVQSKDSSTTREEKINSILHDLDSSTTSLSVQLRDGIWSDAYTFSNTVIAPLIGGSFGVAKMLVFYFHDTALNSFLSWPTS